MSDGVELKSIAHPAGSLLDWVKAEWIMWKGLSKSSLETIEVEIKVEIDD